MDCLDRTKRIAAVLDEAGLDAVACTLPMNVLMLTGYWPVVGTACAVATKLGEITLVAPADEHDLARSSCAHKLYLFEGGSLTSLAPTIDAMGRELARAVQHVAPAIKRLGTEQAPASVAPPYVGMQIYGPALEGVLRHAFTSATISPGDDALQTLRQIKTPREIAFIEQACEVAEMAYLEAPTLLQPGVREIDAASALTGLLSTMAYGREGVMRAGGEIFCMAGPHAAVAHGSHAGSTDRALEAGELVMVHCNNHVNGYWADVTRTYCTGEPDARQRKMFAAVLAARDAALRTIRPGVTGREVDEAVRMALHDHGFAQELMKHPTGHGCGFTGIDHQARPRLHPLSPDVLEPGMICNVEPGLYLDDCGMRHCDMVAVTDSGAQLLTPFQETADELVMV